MEEEVKDTAVVPEEAEEVKGTVTAPEEEEEKEIILGFDWKQIAIAVAALVAVITSIVLLVRFLKKKK